MYVFTSDIFEFYIEKSSLEGWYGPSEILYLLICYFERENPLFLVIV